MKLPISLPAALYTIISLTQTILASASLRKTDKWKIETLGEANAIDSDMPRQSQAEVDTYKKNLLQYVLQTDEPPQVRYESKVPYIMDKLYNLLADKSTGRERRSAPFEVDLIRGLEDHYGELFIFIVNFTLFDAHSSHRKIDNNQ